MGDGLANRAWRAIKGAAGAPSAPGSGLIASVVNVGVRIAATVAHNANQALGVAVAAVVRSLTVDTRPALSVTTRVDTTAKPAVSPGVVVSGANTVTTKATTTPAVALSTLVSPTAKPVVNPALAVTTRLVSGDSKVTVNPAPGVSIVGRNAQTPTNPAPALTQISFNLTHNKGGVTATATGTWTTATNAQGDKNTTLATAAGEATAQTKTLKLDYTDLANKGSMILTAVRLIFYSRLAGALLDDTTVRFERSLDGGTNWATLATVTADYDELVSGRSFTLSPLPTLAEVQALQARMTVVLPAVGTTKSLAIDAIHLEVVAAETWLV